LIAAFAERDERRGRQMAGFLQRAQRYRQRVRTARYGSGS
jgi:hypothetical protein